MANQKIKLKKEIFSSKHNVRTNIDERNFSEISKSPKAVDEKTIVNTYQNVFYDIPKTGKTSHESIAKQSFLFLNPQEESRLEHQIETRQGKLSLLSDRLFELSSPSIKEHPIYPDGTILRINAEDTAGTNIQNPYIMQEGTKRYFANDMLYNIVRRALGQPEQDFTQDVIYISLQEAILIPDGEEIKTAADLNKRNIEIIDRIENIPTHGLKISCVGTETTSYINNIVNADTVDYSINLDEDCSLLIAETYYDEDGITLLSRVKEIKIPAVGASTEAAYVRTGDNISIPLSSVPEMIEPAYADYFSNWAFKEPYINAVYEDRDKIWGKFPDGTYRKYPAIIKAIGRMYYKEKDDLGDWTPPKLLNGVNNDYLPDYRPHDGSETSIYNTSLLFNNCINRFGQPTSICFGNLGQGDTLQQLFSQPNFQYYQKSKSYTFKIGPLAILTIEGLVYGQPIFKRKNKFVVLLGIEEKSLKIAGETIFEGKIAAFYELGVADPPSGGLIGAYESLFLGADNPDNFQIIVETGIGNQEMNMLGTTTREDKIDYRFISSDNIQFPGLQGYALNDSYNGTFAYNPVGDKGNNHGLTSYTRQWL